MDASDSSQTLADIVGTPSTPDTNDYLKHLTTLPLSDLLAEPTVLQTQAHHLTSSLVTLASTSYPTFLAVHKSATALNASLDSLSTSLDALVSDSLPALEQCASGWKNRTDAVLEERKRARVVLEQHEKLRDLLDIPLLIDTCVRNGYFGEALALAAHARSLTKLFEGDNAIGGDAVAQTESLKTQFKPSSGSPPLIISSILAEVDQSMTQMLVSLLATLHEPHRKLPALWKAVNFLRRMDVFGRDDSTAISSSSSSVPVHPVNINGKTPNADDEVIEAEMHIALAFLSGREACLIASLDGCGRDIQSVIRAMQDGKGSSTEADDGVSDGDRQLEERELEDIARYLKKYIDTWREGVYDIITQYTTIFLERSPLSTSSPNSPTSAQSLQVRRDLHASLHSLLSTYGSHALTKHLLPTLSSASTLLALSALPSLLTQLTYCASAFGRVGLDFRALLAGIIGDAVVAAVGREVRSAEKTWTQELTKSFSSGEGDADTTTQRASKRRSGIGKSGPRVERAPSKWVVSSNLASSPPLPDASASSSSSPVHVPPPILASYPPLANLTNALLTTLNGLRLLAPHHVRSRLVVLMEDTLVRCGSVLIRYAVVVGGEKDEAEVRIVKALGEVYFGVFVPFLRRALVEGVYGGKLAEVYASDSDSNSDSKEGMDDKLVGRQMDESRREWDAWTSSSNK